MCVLIDYMCVLNRYCCGYDNIMRAQVLETQEHRSMVT